MGSGQPPFCDDHAPYDADDFDDEPSPIVMAVADRLVQHPATGRVLDSFGGLLDKIGGMLDGSAFQQQQATAGAAQASVRRPPPRTARRATPPPPPSRPQPAYRDTPRVILGFPETGKLTRELVKKRHRDFAKICHSDKGGSDASMQRINWARDELLKECR